MAGYILKSYYITIVHWRVSLSTYLRISLHLRIIIFLALLMHDKSAHKLCDNHLTREYSYRSPNNAEY